MLEGMFDSRDDDRGRPLPRVSRDVILQTVWPDRPIPIRATRAGPLAIVAGLLILVFACAYLSRNPTAARAVPVYVYILGFLFIVGWRLRDLSRDSTTASKDRQLTRERITALLAAHGRCGACGYDLTGVPPDPDACALCPECGAAWSTHRATIPAAAALTSPVLARHLRSRRRLGEHALSTDDRRVPLESPSFLMKRWIRRDPRGREFWHSRLEPRREAWSWLVGRVKSGTVVLWLFALAAFLVATPLHGASLTDFIAFALVTGLFAGAVIVVAWRSGRNIARDREIILAALVCPNCHADLPAAQDRRPTFDGCTACSGCGRAWRLSEA